MALVTLPDRPRPRTFSPRYIDFGFTQKPAGGARELRIDRPGNRFGAVFEFPPMEAVDAEIFVSRLLQAKSLGVRIALPLLVPQGAPGAVTVDGSGQSGSEIDLENLTKGHVIREGYWLTIYDDAGPGGDGTGYLHRATASVSASAAGKATVPIVPPLRAPFVDGASVELAHPTIEGLVTGESYEWQVPVDRLIRLTVPMAENA